MRIAFVNAFSLPEFVSGATIQADDLAVGLTQRGHSVALLSGARRAGDRPFAEAHHTHRGIEVTTLNTEPFIAFDDPLNYDNPEAARSIDAWLQSFQPDLIHAHSLQGLGATWIDDAARRAPVVVTLHDAWWVCSRQFLVRAELTFDGPLAEFAGCECSGGVEFNQARRRWLADRLARASAIIAPSAAHADLMAIDGLDPARITIVPNGMRRLGAPSEDAGAATRPHSPPTLGYVGQWHDFKGLPLLLEARRRLPDQPLPFKLRCWGAAESPEADHLPPGVELLPSYPPEQTATVMASVDALAIPSFSPESFSLVAREALACGAPVICCDIGGQAEVVRHGENGLLVETGSIAAWAAALERWSRDAGLQRRLLRGAAGGIETSTVDEQLDRVETLYQSTAAGTGLPAVVGVGPGALEEPVDVPVREQARRERRPGVPPPMLVVAGIGGATLRYGGYQLAQAHRSLGADATVVDHRHPAIPELVPEDGVVVLYRVPWSRWMRRCIDAARARRATVIFEVDDLIFDPGLRDRIPALRALPPADAELWLEDTERYRMTAHASDVVLATTPEIAAAAVGQGLQAEVHYYGLGQETALMSQAALRLSQERRAARQKSGVFRIGYLTGTDTHNEDWAMVESAVAEVLARHANAELWLVGPLRTGRAIALDDPRVKRIPFRPLQELPALHTELDTVLAPLLPGLEFSEAKSAVKWIEAGAAGVPVVASPAGAFREFIVDGVTGLLAGPDGWFAAIDQLAADADFRVSLGRAARSAVYRDHGPWARARAWDATLSRILEAKPDRTTPRLPDAGPDRPPTPTEIEPEPPAGYVDYASGAAETTVDLAGAGTIESILRPTLRGLYRVDIHTTTFGRRAVGPLQLELLDSAGGTLRAAQLEEGDVADDGWSAWRFAPLTGEPQELRLKVSQPGAKRDGGAGCWAALESGERLVNGRPARGALHLRSFSSATRLEVCAAALDLDLSELAPIPGAGSRRWRVLYHKGLHSIRSRGVRETASRTVAYARRWQRGRRRRTP